MAGQGTLITALDYNGIQNKIAAILGTGSGQSGYGQGLSTGNVARDGKIELAQWLNLREDLRKARDHQYGTGYTTAGTATNGAQLQVPTSSLVISEALRNQYNLFADAIIVDKFRIGTPGQFSPETLLTNSRTFTWNGVVYNTITITGSSSGAGSVANMRYFFNAGGNFQITMTRTGAAAHTKDTTWGDMLSNTGTISMNYNTVTASGPAPGTIYSIGYYGLTTSNQLIYTKPAPAGVYLENDYNVYARINGDASQVIFTLEFRDDDTGDQRGGFLPGPSIDEDVTGTFNMTLGMNRPSGSNVSVLSPTATNTGIG
jgi:hypothetical protein